MSKSWKCPHTLSLLVFLCLPLRACASIASIGLVLLENKVIHAGHSQAIPGLANVLKKARGDLQGTTDMEKKQEVTPAPSSNLQEVNDVPASSSPKSAMVVAIVILAMIVILVLMNMLISAGRRQASSVHWSSVGASGQPQTGSSLAVQSAPGSARLLDFYDAAKSNGTAHFGSGHLQASSAQSIQSESTTRLSYPYLNQKRAVSSSSVASRMSGSSGVNENGNSEVLCLALLVQQQDGVRVECNGAISSEKQEGILDVITAGRTIMRILFSEFGLDSGILVESMMRSPIAFMNTTKAWSSDDLSNDRRVLICRSLPASGGTSGTDPFAVVMPDPSPMQTKCLNFQVRRGVTGPLMAHVRLQPNDMRVTSGEGLLLASLDGRLIGTSLEQVRMHIQPNVDASLVVCVLLAAVKLM